MKKKALKSFFGFFFLLTSIIASDLVLPKPTGKYSVGTKAIELTDSSRQMLRDHSPRRWMVQIFYPCEKHENLSAYMPGTLKNGKVEESRVLTYALPDAFPLTSQKFPTIIFIPGLGEERQKYTLLHEELASHGYIILSIDQPYVSNFVAFPDGTKIVLSFKDAWNIPRDRNYRYTFYDEAMDVAIKDISYMLKHLETLKDHASIDTKNIVLMGHSFGGNVAHTLGFKDDRIKAVIDIDSKITDRKIFGWPGVPPNTTLKPVFFIRGALQYQEDVGNQLAEIANSTIWAPLVQHSAFSDQAYFASRSSTFGIHGFFYQFFHWFFKQGPHFDRIDTSLGRYNPDTWFFVYKNQILNWLKNSNI